MAMEKMLFPVQFIQWIRKCVASCMVSIKINGALEGYFQCKNGLRQGDPLSPYLFVIGMEVLTSFLNYKLNGSDFSYHWRTKEMNLSHVIFTDDIFLFCKGDLSSIHLLLSSVLSFSRMSGLTLNRNKSFGYYCNVADNVIDVTQNQFGIQRGSLPIVYLGLPLVTGRLNPQLCCSLIQKISAKIDLWTVRSLRYSGRLQLLKSVLQGIQGYWSLHLFLPKNVLKKLQSLFAKFLWGGTISGKCHYKVAWVDCCKNKDEGGLGIRDIFEWNRAVVLLQIWRLTQPNPSSVWNLWVHSCLLKRKFFWTAKIPYKCPWNLRKIFNFRSDALQFLTCKVKTSSQFKLWHDPWLINSPLIEKFGTGIVSIMDSTPDALVGSFIENGRWRPHTSNEYRAVQVGQLLLSCTIGESDVVYWNGESNVCISVLWNSIRRHGVPGLWLPLIWHKFHIPSCSFITWLAFHERLLTKDRMSNFQAEIDQTCVLCNSYNENHEHLFSICPFTYILLRDCPFRLNINWANWQQGISLITTYLNLKAASPISTLQLFCTLFGVKEMIESMAKGQKGLFSWELLSSEWFVKNYLLVILLKNVLLGTQP